MINRYLLWLVNKTASLSFLTARYERRRDWPGWLAHKLIALAYILAGINLHLSCIIFRGKRL